MFLDVDSLLTCETAIVNNRYHCVFFDRHVDHAVDDNCHSMSTDSRRCTVEDLVDDVKTDAVVHVSTHSDLHVNRGKFAELLFLEGQSIKRGVNVIDISHV